MGLGERLWLGLLFAGASAWCLHFGRRGFMPLDQSIIFDGGWRILSGQIPYRDFTAPNGLVPIYLQAGFFKLLGVSWWSYCLHAALFNGLFCVAVHRSLRLVGLSPLAAGFYAAASSVVAYTPFGVPFMDQHAFILSFLALYLSLEACHAATTRGAGALWSCCALVGLGALLSKQIPTLLILPLTLVPWLACSMRRRISALGFFLLGLLLGSGIFLLWARLAGVQIHDLVQAMLQLPARQGSLRLHLLLHNAGIRTARLGPALAALNLPSVWVLQAGVLVVFKHFLPGATSPARARTRRQATALVLLAEGLLLCSLLTASVTLNDPENSLAGLFAALGLTHGALLKLAPKGARGTPALLKKRTFLPGLLLLVLVPASGWDAWTLNRQINPTRKVHDHGFSLKNLSLSPPPLPEPLRFMIWDQESRYPYPAADLTRLLNWLKAHPGNFFLLGDSSILYALARRPSVNPALWFHPGLTFPLPGRPAFEAFEQRLMASLKHHHVRYIIQEGPQTAESCSPTTFPRTTAYLAPRLEAARTFGVFQVFRLK